MTKARENSDYTGLAADIVAGDTAARAGRKNLIINGRLGTNTMVNQRGFASGTLNDGDYGFDRWLSASGASVLALNADDVTLTSGKLMQWIEDPHIAGKQITISAKVNSGTLTGRVGTGSIAFQTLPFTITAPSGNLRLELVGNGSQFTNVQLELGSVATDFEHRSYGEILADCQRYFERFDYSGGGRSGLTGQCHSTSIMYGGFQFQPKRATPSISTSTVGNFRIIHRGSATNVSGLAFNANSRCARVGVSTGGGLTSGDAGCMDTDNDNGQYIDIDAEL